MREEKGCFEEEYRGRNWGWERDKLKNRWGIDGSWTGIKRKSNKNGTESCVNIVNVVGKTFISGAERTKLWLRKDLLFKNKRRKRIENEENREKRGYFLGKGISGGWKGIVAIRTSMGAGDF